MAITLAEWFTARARVLPWRISDARTGQRDPYRSLVSEIMLQQTQVSRVMERFTAFVEAFPTVQALALAPESAVLAAWSGLGYYRRARLLHSAAQMIVERFGGRVPATTDELREIPGVGRYTAGAIASIVFGQPEPIVDGNVMRVLMRLHAREGSQEEALNVAWAWERAGALARSAGALVGNTNEGLMELGATVCTPSAPRCDGCPLARGCRAFAAGRQELIPPPKAAAGTKKLLHASVRVRDEQGRVLMEQRPRQGLWGNMWQVATVEVEWKHAPRVRRWLKEQGEGVFGSGLQRAEAFDAKLTHRVVRFEVWDAAGVVSGARANVLAKKALAGAAPGVRRWATPEEIGGLGVSNPQRRILAGIGTQGLL